MKLSDIQHKDIRFHNNVFAGRHDLAACADSAHVEAAGNLFLEDARFLMDEKEGAFLLSLPAFPDGERTTVNSERLGKAKIPDAPFVQPDGKPVRLDADYFGKQHDTGNPCPGPFASGGGNAGPLKVWPK
jgi:hypothetical protein